MAKILVVDDEPGYRTGLEFFLSRGGHEVLAVADISQSVEEALQFAPDVLIADWLLGARFTGADLARTLSEHLPNLQVILITGLDANAVRRQLAGFQVYRILEKPFEPATMGDAVRGAIAGLDAAHGSVGS